MTDTDPTSTAALAVARRLVGEAANVRRLPAGGRNSRIYRVDNGITAYALKQYPSRQFDPRDRLVTEVRALRLMEAGHIANVPRVVAVDAEAGYALLSWIDGTVVNTVTDNDIDAVVNFLAAIHTLSQTPSAEHLSVAAEACLSAAETDRQIRSRRAGMQALMDNEPELGSFLEESFDPAYQHWLAKAKYEMAAVRLEFDTELPPDMRSLVPSDIGFHNSLRRHDGSLAFVDFEYFGWDDPVKMIADILLHPGHTLANNQRRRLRRSVDMIYPHDNIIAARLTALLPLFGLRWVLILLNEFSPERWQNRVLAGASEGWDEAKSRQLDKARVFLASLPGVVET